MHYKIAKKVYNYEASVNNYKTLQLQCAVFNFAITYKQKIY